MRGKEGTDGGTVSRKIPALDNLGDSRPFQIPNGAKSRECTLKKHALEKGLQGGWTASAVENRDPFKHLSRSQAVKNSLFYWWGSP